MMNEKISALVDQEGSPDEKHHLFDHILIDDDAHKTWQRYHLIGCVMRGEVEQIGPDLCGKIRSRLENEPTMLAPTGQSTVVNLPPRADTARTEVWKSAGMLAIAASIALMAVITLKPAENVQTGQIASNATPTVDLSAKAMFEQEFGEMLVQHGEFTSSSGLNGLVAYAKLVSNEFME
jgi:sigma-E factor negative regulatory protein RseA